MDPKSVACCHTQASTYPEKAPFHPSQSYPEYRYDGELMVQPNHAYGAVRECFRLAGLDSRYFGTAYWNPLGSLVRPGQTVLIKPNLVKSTHPRDRQGWRYVLTHGSMIRALADYLWMALDERGAIIVADAPQTDSSFRQIARVLQLEELARFYQERGLDFQVLDLRKEEWTFEEGVVTSRETLAGDPAGYVAFDLGRASEFEGHRGAGRYYGADYDQGVVNRHHTGGRHEYLISGSVVRADVVFSLPKLKTHKKAGITVSLKNLVGVNGDKNWLPHHTEPSLLSSGDERPNGGWKQRAERLGARALRSMALALPGIGGWLHRQSRRAGSSVFGETSRVIRSGNWWGNDTIWRMCLDLNKAVFYGNPDGSLRPEGPASRKPHYVLVDGLLAGEGAGPMDPDPKRAGLVVFGTNPASVDAACAVLMGFDPERIPIVRQAFRCEQLRLAEWDWRDVSVASNRAGWNRRLPEIPVSETLSFEPHFGWKGHIERNQEEASRYGQVGEPVPQAAHSGSAPGL